MRILIDIGHPAHVHLFKNFARIMLDKGNQVLFTCRDREHVIYLLKHYNFDFVSFGKHFKTIYGKLFSIISYLSQMVITGIKFKPDILLSHGSTCAAQASFILRKPHIAFEDTYNKEQVRLSMPFTDVVLTGDYPHPDMGKKEIQVPGYNQLAYLHHNVFQPDVGIRSILGVKEYEKYAIVRFVAFGASHDIGHKGISNKDKVKLVEIVSKHMKVFVSSEIDLPSKLIPHKININPEKMHDALFFADLLIGESGSMAVESAVLGTPSVVVNTLAPNMSMFKELTYKYNLMHVFSNIDEAWIIIKNIVSDPNYKSGLKAGLDRMIKDKIDVTAFLVWFIDYYPNSEREVRNPEFDFQRFR